MIVLSPPTLVCAIFVFTLIVRHYSWPCFMEGGSIEIRRQPFPRGRVAQHLCISLKLFFLFRDVSENTCRGTGDAYGSAA